MTNFQMVSYRRAALEEVARFLTFIGSVLKHLFIKKQDSRVFMYVSDPPGELYEDGRGHLRDFDRLDGEPDREAACSWRVGPDGKIVTSPEEWVEVPYL